ncbi:hypothetical protein RD792_015754 [Penstemon davidsonii]|uniref:ATP-dependent helicase BRM n=1 Tax=Penstemon davidsonii TaxID=160366 RepID=A0ABR0CHI9_9LAMI|nr:hypothetical protein RD792_015754 [Penstemon davidsonii]
MHSGGGPLQGRGGVHGWSNAAASASSPSSSSAALAFDQQQRQSLQQFLMRPDGNDDLLAYQTGNIHGFFGGGNFVSASASMPLPQQPRNFIDLGQQRGSPNIPDQSQNRSPGVEQQMWPLPQQHTTFINLGQQRGSPNIPEQIQNRSPGVEQQMWPLPQQHMTFINLGQQRGSPNIPEESQNTSQGVEQQMLNPMQQAYLQYAIQAAQQKSNAGMQPQQQMRPMFGSFGKDQDTRMEIMKMQELVSIQAANQSHASTSKKSSEQVAQSDKQADQSQRSISNHRTDPKSNHGQATPSASMLGPQSQQNFLNMANNQIAMAAQMQAMQAFALEHNIDLSHPANANLMAQFVPLMQSRIVAQQKANESNTVVQSASFGKHVTSQVRNESSPHGNSSNSGQSGSSMARQRVSPSTLGVTPSTAQVYSSNIPVQHFSGYGRDEHLPPRQPTLLVNDMPPMHPTQSSGNVNQGVDSLLLAKSSANLPEVSQEQNFRQLNRSTMQSALPFNDGNASNLSTSQGRPLPQMRQSHVGFTKQQVHALKAQMLVLRRLNLKVGAFCCMVPIFVSFPHFFFIVFYGKSVPYFACLQKVEGTLPSVLLKAIAPPPFDLPIQQVSPPLVTVSKDLAAGKSVDEHVSHMDSSEKGAQVLKSATGVNNLNERGLGDERTAALTLNTQSTITVTKELRFVVSPGKEEQQSIDSSTKSYLEAEPGTDKTPIRSDVAADRGKAVVTQSSVSESIQVKKPIHASNINQLRDAASTRKYHGPLFDFPVFTRNPDSLGSSMKNNNNNLTLSYDIKKLFAEDGRELRKRKREEKIEKIDKILAVNLERKRIKPDLIIRLQIESKKLQLVECQARLRDEIVQQQQEIMAMPGKPYRKFVRLCERQRQELNRQSQANQKIIKEKQLKSIFQWRKKLLETHWAIRDARTTRNRGVHKYHERMLREFSKSKDDDRNKRMEALKNNDVERYREMLLEQQTNISGEASERYAVLSSFLTQTEDYLHKLGGKITASKNQLEVEEAANDVAAAARAQALSLSLSGLSEEEVRAAAACAREEMMIRNRFSEMNAPIDSTSINKYYNLAHAVNERVIRQPTMLRAGTLRDYQLVGLQWMLSLYNNKLNGILADEMGLGKTVQVMALIAYLMEFKGNYGPHLIIVPNAVLVNWKSELRSWLPAVSCIYYVGGKDQRSKLFSQEVLALKFNVLVTTYEFIMYDRSKLSRVDWKYIIIDEAQRMKDRDSVLARDLDRYRCQRRLLLTGTPLQNDLKELWSLLNLLLPEVFDNRKAFHDWFSQPFQKEGPTHNAEDDWLETEKKVIIIHRLHQILEPFMLRRRVEDVEGSLPPKVSIVLKCRMSAIQSAIYDWIKSTGTLRVDPEDENRKAKKNTIYQAKIFKTLNNRCMELRKACNHPLLNYPYFEDFSKDFLVRSCGKLWVLDRVLIKLQRTGHKVLLFSTMTKLLDIMEEYLEWRRLVFRRIDGTTSLEDRESAIVDFNRPDTDCFIFLLSIRAAGRGLNLQSADTVIIYDPDPNPKNEEQAVARAHRIGQTREVKVIYMEAVVDKIPSHQKEDEFKEGGTVDSDDDLAGKDRYVGSIESLIRNNIQQYKIDMADEVINAGRFDQRTTHEERRLTLETLLHDEERYQETVHDVPSLHEVNRMIARSEAELELFDQMDEELDWEAEMTRYDQVPKWLCTSTKEVNATIASLSKKPSKGALYGGSIAVGSSEVAPETKRKRGRPKGKVPIYTELGSETSSDDRNGDSVQEEEGEIGEFEDDESTEAPLVSKHPPEEDGPVTAEGDEYQRALENISNNTFEEEGSSGSSLHSKRLMQMVSPSLSSQKFGSLSALDDRPNSHSKKSADEVEGGEIAASGDSVMDHQQSGRWIQDGEDEQVLQPKIKRKRSIRLRPQHSDKPSLSRGNPFQLPFQVELKYKSQVRDNGAHKVLGDPSSLKPEKSKQNLPSRKTLNEAKMQGSVKAGKINNGSTPPDDATEYPRENWHSKVMIGPSSSVHKMSEVIQRKCKNVISKLQRKIDKEGREIIPLLTELWSKLETCRSMTLRKIDLRIDKFEYRGVMELVSDVQLMLKGSMQYYDLSYEVRSEARKVHDLFFDILEIAFPDIEFREAKKSLSFSSCAAKPATGPSLRQTLSKRQIRVPHEKESKLSQAAAENDAPAFTHPGDLVICKKKRNEREKSGGMSPTIKSPGQQSGWATALSPLQGNTSGGSSFGWANPVKKMRTDAGRRRPSHT